MRVHGVEITDEQIAAGLSAMRGTFTFEDVREVMVWHRLLTISGDVADRLLQRERRAGRIKHIGAGKWQLVPALDNGGGDAE